MAARLKKKKKKLPRAQAANSAKAIAFLKHTVPTIRSFGETIMNLVASLIGVSKELLSENFLELFPLCLFSLLINTEL